MGIYIIIAIIALGVLIVQFIFQFRRIKKGRSEKISRGAIIFNWLALLILLVSIGGAAYTGLKSHREAVKPAPVAKSLSSTSPATGHALKLDFAPDVTMDANGLVKIKITVSNGAKVTIKGRNTGNVYQSFTVSQGRGTSSKTITLDSAGPYQISASKNGQRVVKDLIVRQAKVGATASTPVVISSSSINQAPSVNNTSNPGTRNAAQTSVSQATTTANSATTDTGNQVNNQ